MLACCLGVFCGVGAALNGFSALHLRSLSLPSFKGSHYAAGLFAFFNNTQLVIGYHSVCPGAI